MMDSYQVIQLIYYICAPITIIVTVYFGLKSYLNKQKENVLNLCKSFQKETIPQYISIIDYRKKKKLESIGSIWIDKEHGIVHKPQKMNKGYEEYLQKVMLLFNDMDMFAANLLKNARFKKKIAFEIQGNAFCEIIDDLKSVYDLFLYTNAQDYVNLAKLYNIWSARKRKTSLLTNM